MLAERLEVPHIWHVHEFIRQGVGLVFDRGTRRSLKYAGIASSALICNSQAVAQMIRRDVSAARIRVVHNGVSQSSRLPCGPRMELVHLDEPRLALVGALMPHKGHADAIRAVRLLRERGVRTKLSIVGTSRHPWYPFQLRRMIRTLRLTEEVTLEGFIPRAVEAVLPHTDVALICSRCEAFGLVAAEAMSIGCPVIGTDSGGLPEVIENGVSGLLYPFGNVERLAAALERVLGDAALYRRLSENGIQRVRERFTLERYVAGIESVIREVLDGGPLAETADACQDRGAPDRQLPCDT